MPFLSFPKIKSNQNLLVFKKLQNNKAPLALKKHHNKLFYFVIKILQITVYKGPSECIIKVT